MSLGGGRINMPAFIKGWNKINNSIGFKTLATWDLSDPQREGTKTFRAEFKAIGSNVKVYIAFMVFLKNASDGLTGNDPVTTNSYICPVDYHDETYTSITSYKWYTDAINGDEVNSNYAQMLVTELKYTKSSVVSGDNYWELEIEVDFDKLNTKAEGAGGISNSHLYFNPLIIIDDETYSYRYDANPIHKNNDLVYTDIDDIIKYLNKKPILYPTSRLIDDTTSKHIYKIVSNNIYSYSDIGYLYKTFLVPDDDSMLSYVEATMITDGINIPNRKRIMVSNNNIAPKDIIGYRVRTVTDDILQWIFTDKYYKVKFRHSCCYIRYMHRMTYKDSEAPTGLTGTDLSKDLEGLTYSFAMDYKR